MLDIEDYEARDKGISFNMNTKWALNSLLLTNLNLIVSGNLRHQVGHEVTLRRYLQVHSLSLWPLSRERTNTHPSFIIHQRSYD